MFFFFFFFPTVLLYLLVNYCIYISPNLFYQRSLKTNLSISFFPFNKKDRKTNMVFNLA